MNSSKSLTGILRGLRPWVLHLQSVLNKNAKKSKQMEPCLTQEGKKKKKKSSLQWKCKLQISQAFSSFIFWPVGSQQLLIHTVSLLNTFTIWYSTAKHLSSLKVIVRLIRHWNTKSEVRKWEEACEELCGKPGASIFPFPSRSTFCTSTALWSVLLPSAQTKLLTKAPLLPFHWGQLQV